MDLEPEEMLYAVKMSPRWWDRNDVLPLLDAPSITIFIGEDAFSVPTPLISGNTVVYPSLGQVSSVSILPESPFSFDPPKQATDGSRS